MKLHGTDWIVCAVLVAATVSGQALTPEQLAQLPPSAPREVSFREDVRPILEEACVKCHGRGKSNGGFRMDTRATLLTGGHNGEAVIPGDSARSWLIELVMGFDPETMMPQKGTKLSREQVAVLRAWIDQGVKWEEGFTFAKPPPRNLHPATPVLPVGPQAFTARNAIDLILESYYAGHDVQTARPVDDRLFARRVYLDVVGLLPAPAELAEFLADARPDKRTQLVRRLLADNARYAEHWLTFWNDLLRNDYRGTGYIDGGRKQITGWLYEALATNKPYDQFVRELIDPNPESEGFSKGIVWRGTVNASELPPIQAAQNIAQVFMGVNLKCASCHDSFINDWTLADAYGLASVYADEPLEMVRCDKPTGRTAEIRFIYPELGAMEGSLPKAERTRRLAEIMTQENNARLTRTLVNRLWARFMGRGLVGDLDDMEQPAWHPELLDWLAADLTANRYDVKKTIERILTSDAYQRPAVPATESGEHYIFRGPSVRRLNAEQFADAVSSITGLGEKAPHAQANFFAGRESAAATMDRAAWIWNGAQAREAAPVGTVYFRKEFTLPEKLHSAGAVVSADNSFQLYVNGRDAGSGKDHTRPSVVDLQPHLKPGRNLIAIAATNDSAERGNAVANPAGLLVYARIRALDAGTGRELNLDLVSDASWRCSSEKADGWMHATFTAPGWSAAVPLGTADVAPWKLRERFARTASSLELLGRTRASLVAADPLMLALGRPNREQVLPARASNATTLQALELTNGSSLNERLQKGAEKLLRETSRTTDEWVREIYLRALGRPPSPSEQRLAAELVGSPVRPAGIEDLIWALTLLPEFQLIL